MLLNDSSRRNDIALAKAIASGTTAHGIAFCPRSCQDALRLCSGARVHTLIKHLEPIR